MTPEEFRAELAKHGVKLSDEQMQQFQTYYEFLVATNEHSTAVLTRQLDCDHQTRRGLFKALL